ncbi:SLC13 family permease [Mailhella massiliensis]|uniref:SLC13 family permease n=1 Tax=Mailhella massiliensis TaxID=1903261 RepID=UPI00097D6C33|nr:SLC13 family permease [Mailhella massiliensis]
MPVKSLSLGTIIHTVIGIGLMFLGHVLPCPSLVVPVSDALVAAGFPVADGNAVITITRMGMVNAMIFLGVVYLWTFVDTLWPCFLGVLMLAFSGFTPAPKVLNSFLGNPMVVMIFFTLCFATALIRSNVSSWLAQWILRRDFIIGRPWTFTAVILVTSYLLAFFEQTSICFLIWPVMYSIFDQVGFKRGDKYVSVMLVYIIVMALLSFASDPFKTGAFLLLGNVWGLAASNPGMNVPALPAASYFCFALVVSLVSIALLMAAMRFVYRVDVSPLLKLDPAVLRREPLKPMTGYQIGVLVAFALFACWILLPGIIGKDNVVGAFLAKNSLLAPLVALFLVGFVHLHGKPIADISETAAAYPWRIFLLIAVAMLLGDAMTGKGTNVTIYMEYVLRNALSGFGYVPLCIAVILLGITFTNFCNSVVLGLVLTPVLLAMCNAFGMNAGPLMACFIYAVLIAACTPAASPFAAMLFGNSQWLSPREIVTYSVSSSLIIAGVVIVIGIPLAMVIF